MPRRDKQAREATDRWVSIPTAYDEAQQVRVKRRQTEPGESSRDIVELQLEGAPFPSLSVFIDDLREAFRLLGS